MVHLVVYVLNIVIVAFFKNVFYTSIKLEIIENIAIQQIKKWFMQYLLYNSADIANTKVYIFITQLHLNT